MLTIRFNRNKDYHNSKVIIFNKLFYIVLDSWQAISQPFLGKRDRDWGGESSKKKDAILLKRNIASLSLQWKETFP